MTLSEVNQHFGYLPTLTDDDPIFQRPLERPPQPSDAAAVLGTLRASSGHRPHDDSIASFTSPPAITEGENSISSLRAKLAQMIDLPENATPGGCGALATNSEDSSQENDDKERSEGVLATLIGQVDGERPLNDSHSVESSLAISPPDLTGRSTLTSSRSSDLPVTQASSETVADSLEESVDEDDPWTQRLRELSQVAGRLKSSTPAAVSPNPAALESESSEVEQEEHSVEAQLARLLGRSQRKNGSSSDSVTPPQRHEVPAELVGRDLSETVTFTLSADAAEADRSHLTEEPRHRQNKNAVREDMQSFRAVAQWSARSALAKHSWNNLRAEIYFKAGLAALSAAAAVWIAGTRYYGIETESWKVITCAVTTLVCLQRLFYASSKIQLWRTKNKEQPAARKMSATPNNYGAESDA